MGFLLLWDDYLICVLQFFRYSKLLIIHLWIIHAQLFFLHKRRHWTFSHAILSASESGVGLVLGQSTEYMAEQYLFFSALWSLLVMILIIYQVSCYFPYLIYIGIYNTYIQFC
jgi:hypothetical protein